MKALKTSAENAAKAKVEEVMAEGLAQVDTRVKAATEAAEAAVVKASQAAVQAVPVPSTQEQPVTATLGSLGYDCTEVEICQLAAKPLLQADVPKEWHHEPHTLRDDKLSCVQVELRNIKLLLAAGRRIRKQRMKFPNTRSSVWLDVQKTEEELRPGKWCRRAEQWMLRELRDWNGGPLEIRANLRTKTLIVKDVNAGGGTEVEVGAPGMEQWVWFRAADTYLSAERRDVGVSYISR